jgi:hypothetical protein
MSHFMVLVAGKDPTYQLAPFHEFECTGTDDEFVKDVDKTEEFRKEYELATDKKGRSFEMWCHEYHGKEMATAETLDIAKKHKYGYILLDADGKCVKVIRRTNPEKRWDWWVVGSRYSERLLLKNRRRVDQAKKSEIDFTTMRQQGVDKALEKWDAAHAVLDLHQVHESWDVVRDRIGMAEIEAARTAYHAQPGVTAFKLANPHDWDGPDEFLVPREQYAEEAGDSAMVPGFAFVQDRKWSECGEMGWWACVTNEMSAADWNKAKREWIESLPDDTLITVVDCHI